MEYILLSQTYRCSLHFLFGFRAPISHQPQKKTTPPKIKRSLWKNGGWKATTFSVVRIAHFSGDNCQTLGAPRLRGPISRSLVVHLASSWPSSPNSGDKASPVGGEGRFVPFPCVSSKGSSSESSSESSWVAKQGAGPNCLQGSRIAMTDTPFKIFKGLLRSNS